MKHNYESIGVWNKNTVRLLSLKTGTSVDDLWNIIISQNEIEHALRRMEEE